MKTLSIDGENQQDNGETTNQDNSGDSDEESSESAGGDDMNWLDQLETSSDTTFIYHNPPQDLLNLLEK